MVIINVGMSVKINDIPLPEGLSDVDKVEFRIFQKAVARLQSELEQLEEGTNPDQLALDDILTQLKEEKMSEADQRFHLRLEVVNKEAEKRLEAARFEFSEAKNELFERMAISYAESDGVVTARLKHLLGDEYDAFISEHPEVDRPLVHSEVQMQTRLRQAKSDVSEVSMKDVENDLIEIEQLAKET